MVSEAAVFVALSCVVARRFMWVHHEDDKAPVEHGAVFERLNANFSPYLLFYQRDSDL